MWLQHLQRHENSKEIFEEIDYESLTREEERKLLFTKGPSFDMFYKNEN